MKLRFLANGGTPLKLPNSGISVNVWSSIEDYADGCWDWKDCFWLSPMFRTEGVGNLTPDMPVKPSFGDYVDGKDIIVETIIRDIKEM